MVLRNVVVANREELRGVWRKLHIGELRDSYCSPNIIGTMIRKRMRSAGYVARVEEKNAVCLGGKT
jgi:hypothetical protein